MPQQSEILQMLVESACADGFLADSDRILLEQKAKAVGVSKATLEEMIRKAIGQDEPLAAQEQSPSSEPQPKVIQLQPSSPSSPSSSKSTTQPTIISTESVSAPSGVDMTLRNKKTPYIIAIVVAAALVVTLFFLNFRTSQPIQHDQPDTDTLTIDSVLDNLIRGGEDVFKTKNVARAKQKFLLALNQYPNNEMIIKRLEKCDSIIKAAEYASLTPKRGLSPDNTSDKLGFADTQGYIVVDFLYDEEIGRKSDIMALKVGNNYGVVGGSLKEPSEFKYVEVIWIPSKKQYRLVKDNTGAAEFAGVENDNLLIYEY